MLVPELKKLSFSGHDSFQCRSLWLKKGYDFLKQDNAFTNADAPVMLGVGNNMVRSIRYWLRAFGMTDERDQQTHLADLIGKRNEQHNDPNHFARLWDVSEEFLTSAKTRRRRVSALYETLSQPPFRLKQGFLDFWVPTFLFLRRDDYALFGEKGYVPKLSDETLDLVIKYPDAYEIKAFDIEGMKLNLFNSYREFLQISNRDSVDNQAFIETIRPFLTFYRGLTDYAKHTRILSKPALAIRTAIANSTDPERTFFEDFPTALGYNLTTLLGSSAQLSEYIQDVEGAIRDIRQAYGELLNRFEQFIQHEIVVADVAFADYKVRLQERYARLS